MFRRVLFIATLVIAGEMVFGLPFHVARFFRPTMLDVFGFTNTQLGDIFAIYGITATLSFFPGGALADRFSARKLLTMALIATAAGGLYMSTIPGAAQMAVLYGYFGVTSIFLLWGCAHSCDSRVGWRRIAGCRIRHIGGWARIDRGPGRRSRCVSSGFLHAGRCISSQR